MTNPFQIQFTLRQHTPLIHFQHDQDGATLRATEVKPKLDRFLIEQFKKEGIDFSDWLITGQQGALDYKIKIVSKGAVRLEEIPERSGFPFLALMMGDEYKKNLKAFSYVPIEDTQFSHDVVITCFHDKFRFKIEALISLFFATHNFGTRQGKGFGSFYTALEYEASDANFKSFDLYFDVSVKGKEKNWNYWQSLFQRIEDDVYKKLRQSIVLDYHDTKMLNNYLPHKPRTKDLTRDLLGLSTEKEWKATLKEKNPRFTDEITDEKQGAYKVDRFATPILIKPIKTSSGYRIFIKAQEIDKRFFNQLFSSKKGDRKSPKKFNVHDFMQFAKNELPILKDNKTPQP
jgi:hypothetical protein